MNQIIGKLIKNKPVHIWGAGVSGLVLAYYLKKAGYKVSLYEKSDRPGGKIGTKKTPYGPIELAANAIYLSPDALELLDELNLLPKTSSPKLKRYLYINGKYSTPLSFKLLIKLLLGWRKKIPAFDAPTVEDFFLPLLGQKLIDHLVSPALGGIYASEARGLDMKSLFPEDYPAKTYGEFFLNIKKRLKKNRQMRLKGSASFEGGMQTLIDGLTNELKDCLHLNYQGDFVRIDNTIICTDAMTASEILKGTDYGRELKRITYKKLSSTTIYLKKKIDALKNSFGVLIPRDQKLHTIGILSNSDIFPFNYQDHPSYTFISPEIDEIKEKVISDLQQLAPEIKSEDFIYAETKLYPEALPLYNKERREAIENLHLLARQDEGLILFGNYVAGISLREMITAAKNFSIQ